MDRQGQLLNNHEDATTQCTFRMKNGAQANMTIDEERKVVNVKVSIIVVAWNNRDELRECLDSLKTQSIRDFETIVIDNCSSDGTAEMLASDYPDVVVRQMEDNLGFAEGCNRGIDVAQGEWVCALNSDAVADPDWLGVVCAAIDRADAGTGMFQSKVLFRENPGRVNSTGILLLATGSSGDRDFNAPETEADQAEEIFVPSANAAVYRKKMLLDARLESGYFDRTFFMYSEDLDLGWRCRLLGWKAYYLPGARVLHGYQGSSRKWGDNWADLQCRRNRVRTLLKNGSVLFLVTTVPKTIYDLVIGLRYNGLKTFKDFYEAIRDGLIQREKVTRMLRLPRREVEKKWVTKAIRIKQN